jgi:hypothetical protein
MKVLLDDDDSAMSCRCKRRLDYRRVRDTGAVSIPNTLRSLVTLASYYGLFD